ncbi:MAG TPA: carbohydrate ABC transporter permease [Thermotogota bacterium]|nr:carbohydrate ABC transporter permease [Thermotogota bacterium]HPJ88582.1 carbohydrate ABC transporter permease [Thermotogota bacterium]
MIRKPKLPIRILIYAVLVFILIIINLPFIWMVITSFKTEEEVFSWPPKFYPTLFNFDNYKGAFDLIPMTKLVLNSVFVAGAVTALQLVLNSLAAYGLSRFKFKGRDFVFMLLIGTLMIPAEVIIIPMYVIVKNMGMLNSYASLIVPFMSSAFGIFLLRQFFLGIPKELEDAAFMDGAGRMKIFWKIILPMAKPALWTTAIFSFLGRWNSYMWPLVAINDPDKQMIQVGLSQFSGDWMTQWTWKMAASTTAVIPIIIFFFFIQKQYVEGISGVGIKG